MALRLKGNVKQPPLWLAVEEMHTDAHRDKVEGFEAEMQAAAANLPLTIYQQTQPAPRLSPDSAQSSLIGRYTTLIPLYNPWLSSVVLITFYPLACAEHTMQSSNHEEHCAAKGSDTIATTTQPRFLVIICIWVRYSRGSEHMATAVTRD